MKSKKTKKSFTLIEMVISLAILSIIGAVLAPLTAQGIDLFMMARVQEELAYEVQFALSWMSEELKIACVSLDSFSNDQITFSTCLTCDPANTQVTYQWDSNTDELKRTYLNPANGQTEEDILAQRVRSLEFKGFDDSGDLDLNGGIGVIGDIKVIQLRIIVEDVSETRSYGLVTRIKPRNL